ncbi:MAG: hypothetical protein HWD60_11825 [Defluviicoccus sp.]|nr:MAG: hypothetical protein HWD60_11825 [Defluviicoccus sp.]
MGKWSSYALLALGVIVCPVGLEAANAADPLILSQTELDSVTAGAWAYTDVTLEGSGLPAAGTSNTFTYANSRNYGRISVDIALSFSMGLLIAPSTSGDANADADGTIVNKSFTRVVNSGVAGRREVTHTVAFAIGVDISKSGL